MDIDRFIYINLYIFVSYLYLFVSPGGSVIKSLPAKKRHKRCGFDPWVRKILWSRKWKLETHASILDWEISQRSLAGYSPLGLQRVRHDWACVCMQARTHTHTHTHTHILSPIPSWNLKKEGEESHGLYGSGREMFFPRNFRNEVRAG